MLWGKLILFYYLWAGEIEVDEEPASDIRKLGAPSELRYDLVREVLCSMFPSSGTQHFILIKVAEVDYRQ